MDIEIPVEYEAQGEDPQPDSEEWDSKEQDSVELIAVREKRLYASRMAAHISFLSRKVGVSADSIPWDTLATMPEWCLASNDDRLLLQRVCGAFYLAPLVKRSIDGSLVRAFKGLVGDETYRFIENTNTFLHEVNDVLLENTLELKLMASGSSVLLQTFSDSNTVNFYRAVIGPPGASLQTATSLHIYSVACQVVNAVSHSTNTHQDSDDRAVA